MNREEVLKLSTLVRIEISDSEAENLAKEFDSILGYVGEVKKAHAKAGSDKEKPALRNVMREDTNPHESGIYTEAILKEAPAREGDYIKVKKILG
ncbi:MAG: glutamyl-tRNA(Gln) and/or aspartyl-tRNA(Asn) amidotransferase subunit [Parcubacteria group bacterium]|nr:glutamyl-tRNA(Gln) and/or aspartyl-tRNA(Asn) amidotransferase subunit [Parcubacteria group bacterium]